MHQMQKSVGAQTDLLALGHRDHRLLLLLLRWGWPEIWLLGLRGPLGLTGMREAGRGRCLLLWMHLHTMSKSRRRSGPLARPSCPLLQLESGASPQVCLLMKSINCPSTGHGHAPCTSSSLWEELVAWHVLLEAACFMMLEVLQLCTGWWRGWPDIAPSCNSKQASWSIQCCRHILLCRWCSAPRSQQFA